MNLWLAGVITAAAVAGMVTLMFFVRRRAPVGGFFNDSDRAAGVFGVIGTSFAVLLAFVIFLAFESYQTAKAEAGREAVVVLQQYTTANVFSPDARAELQGELICYGRAVVDDEWRTMRHRRPSRLVDRWADDLQTSLVDLEITGEKQAIAYELWWTEDDLREEARRGRLSEATPIVPPPLWLVLILGAAVVLTYMCAYADSGERFFVQAMMIGAVTAIVASSMLVVFFLDRPYENRSGSIRPVEMTRTLEHIDVLQELSSGTVPVPCDERGRPSAD